LTIERPEIVEALTWLVENGLAKAILTSKGSEIQGMPDVSVVEEDFETYFCITPTGMDLHMSGDGPWPQCDELEP
jgi:hypothetical protein